jgi:hypothetical protein
MNKKINFYILISTLVFVITFFGSCYYDNMEDLYATRTIVDVCDSVNVTYTNTISQKFTDNNCYNCHGTGGPYINFQDYTTFKNYVIVPLNLTKLLDSIIVGHNYASYTSCEKSQLTNWITIGTPQ